MKQLVLFVCMSLGVVVMPAGVAASTNLVAQLLEHPAPARDWMFINSKFGTHSKAPAWYEEEHGYHKETTEGLFFNLERNPAQKENLYASHPEKMAQMNALLERYLTGEGCAPHAK